MILFEDKRKTANQHLEEFTSLSASMQNSFTGSEATEAHAKGQRSSPQNQQQGISIKG